MARAEGQAPPRPMGRPGGMTREVPLMAPQATGHVHLRALKRGPSSTPSSASTAVRRRGNRSGVAEARPPARGLLHPRTAEVELDRIMDEARPRERRPRAHVRPGVRRVARYLEQERGVASTTLRHNRSEVNARLTPFFGEDTPVADITTETIDAYRVHVLVERGLVALHRAERPDQPVRDLQAGQAARLDRPQPLRRRRAGKDRETAATSTCSAVEQVEAVARPLRVARTRRCTGRRLHRASAGRAAGAALAGRRVRHRNLHVRRNLPAHGEEKAKARRRQGPFGAADRPGRAPA